MFTVNTLRGYSETWSTTGVWPDSVQVPGEALSKFEKRSRLVTVDGSGHGVYVIGGNACALNLTTSYLVDGTMPAGDQTCQRG